MKARTLFAIAAFTGVVIALLKIFTGYRKWKQGILDDLQENSRITTTSRGPIEYTMNGDKNGPVVLIAHGTPGGYDVSAAFASLFTDKNISTISISRPGYLRTPLTPNETPEAQADLYAALLDKLTIEQVTMLGISGGGPSSLQFALRHPERCSKLVLLSAVTGYYDEHGRVASLPLIQRSLYYLIDHFRLRDFACFLLSIRAKWLKTPVMATFYRTFTLNELREDGYKNDVAQYIRLQSYPLENIKAPTLVLHGEADDNVPMEHAKHAASHIPNARLIVDEGGDHDFYAKHKERVMPIIEKFVVNNM